MMLALLLSPPLAALRRLANRKVTPGDDDDEGDAGEGTEDGGDGGTVGGDDDEEDRDGGWLGVPHLCDHDGSHTCNGPHTNAGLEGGGALSVTGRSHFC